MFTGIITHLGNIQEKSATGLSIKIPADLILQLKTSGSIAVNGVCLTVTRFGADSFSVDIMPETWKKTALGNLSPDDFVNLELPIQANGRFEGHIVQGHVDGVGTLKNLRHVKNSQILTIEIPTSFNRFIVEKGSVAVNGISLTVIEAADSYFTVGIIPHTWKKTMLHKIKIGEKLNIEVDILAKYLEQFIKHLNRKGTI